MMQVKPDKWENRHKKEKSVKILISTSYKIPFNILMIVSMGNNNHRDLAEDWRIQELGEEWAGIYMINYTFG